MMKRIERSACEICGHNINDRKCGEGNWDDFGKIKYPEDCDDFEYGNDGSNDDDDDWCDDDDCPRHLTEIR